MSDLALTKIETTDAENPQWLMRRATDVAGICREIVKKTAKTIQGRKYVPVEGWQSIATTYGCVLSVRDVTEVVGGIQAIADVRRVADGFVIASGVGFVGEDEPTWYGGEITTREGTKTLPKRANFAIRAMAQTRAMSRAARTAFAFVVVLMDSGLDTTPAEEVPDDDGFGDDEKPVRASGRKTEGWTKPPTEKPATATPDAQEVQPMSDWPDVVVSWGKNKGKRLGDLEKGQVWFLAEKWTPKTDANNKILDPQDEKLKLAAKAGLQELENAAEREA